MVIFGVKLRLFQWCSIEFDWVQLCSKIERNRTVTEIFQFDFIQLSNLSTKFDWVRYSLRLNSGEYNVRHLKVVVVCYFCI